MGKPLELSGGVKVYPPKLKDLTDIENYNYNLGIMITNKMDIADVLWCEAKVFYEDIKNDWLFFVQRAICDAEMGTMYVNTGANEYKIPNTKFINKNYCEAINYFTKLDCQYTAITVDTKAGKQYVLQSLTRVEDKYIWNKGNFILTEALYSEMNQFLREVNWIIPDYQFLQGGTKKAKKYILEENYRARNSKNRKQTVDLASIVSSLIVRGQNYAQIWDYPIYVIYDMYYRLVKVDEYKNTLQALYSGCIDTNKHPIDQEKLNWSAIIKQQ